MYVVMTAVLFCIGLDEGNYTRICIRSANCWQLPMGYNEVTSVQIIPIITYLFECLNEVLFVWSWVNNFED